MKIYLDNAATTPLNQETKNYIISILDDYYNPSSAYQEGRNIRNKIDEARKNIADFILCIMIIEGIVVCLWGLIILQKNRLKNLKRIHM